MIHKEKVCNYKSEEIFLFTLRNNNGIEVKIINYGAIITSISTPSLSGSFDDIVLGFEKTEDYFYNNSPYFGATIGRYTNRIGNAEFTIAGENYSLSKNEGLNFIHGGFSGFDKKIWNSEIIKKTGNEILCLSLISPDGDEGFPGNCRVNTYYSLNEENELLVEYTAQTDKPTHVNFTNHSYFNLSGKDETIENHLLKINSSVVTETNKDLVSNGKLLNIEGTEYDFRKFKTVGNNSNDGFDVNYVFDKSGDELIMMAELYEKKSGRTLKVYSDAPGMQFYSSNFLDGTIKGKKSIPYRKFMALCFEPQCFPNSPNIQHFPSSLLLPEEVYRRKICFSFGIEN